MEFAKQRGENPEQLEQALRSVKKDIDLFVEELKRDPSTPKRDPDDDDDVVTSAPRRSDITRR